MTDDPVVLDLPRSFYAGLLALCKREPG